VTARSSLLLLVVAIVLAAIAFVVLVFGALGNSTAAEWFVASWIAYLLSRVPPGPA
jgi:hypothetical protein